MCVCVLLIKFAKGVDTFLQIIIMLFQKVILNKVAAKAVWFVQYLFELAQQDMRWDPTLMKMKQRDIWACCNLLCRN